jgi:hypothetical protein
VSEKKLKLKDGEIAVGQATRYFNLEILSNSSKSLNEGMEEEVVGDSTARFVFSSEYPVLRYDYWGDEAFYEVLSHDPSSVNTQRITEGVCPILWNHNWDLQRGIVKSVNFTDGKASCDVEYDDNEDGKDLCHLVQKGTRTGVSFMYQVHDEYTELPMKEAVALIEKYRLSDKGYYPVRVSKNWEIFEISHVSVPADPTVGVGKSLQRSEKDEPKIIQIKGYMPKTPLTPLEEAKSLTPNPVLDMEEVKVAETVAEEKPQGLDLEAVKNLILKTVTPVRDQNFVLEQEKSQALAENLSLKQELNQEREEKLKAQQLADALKDISQLIGRPEVEVLPTTKSASAFTMSQGLAREFIDLFSSSRAKPTEVRHEGMLAVQRDHNVLAKFMHDHFREEKAVRGLRDWKHAPLVKELENYFKSSEGGGFLSGRAAGPTIGSSGSIGAIFLDVLSSLMRETHNSNNIWWQFAQTVYDSTSAPNKSVLIPRANNLAAPTDVNDFLISTTDTYTSLNYSRGTSADSQSIEITTVPLTIAQWGLGLSTSVANRPVFIPEFMEVTSLVDLMMILDKVLMQHYFKFEDLMVRKEYFKTTKIYYNDKSEVTSTPADVAATDDGTLTENFLSSVYSQLYADQWPTLPNNCYILTVPPKSLDNLKKSLKDLYSPVTEEQRQNISNVLRAASGIEIGQSSGYVGQYCGFEIFSGNTWGVGAPGGSDPTVNTTSFGAGATVTEDCFVFSYGAVGRGIALPMEVRASGTTPFNMGESFIWISREQTGVIDLDAALVSPAGQQTRCAKLRVARKAV